jgi:hypothetical protein
MGSAFIMPSNFPLAGEGSMRTVVLIQGAGYFRKSHGI